VPDEQRSDRYLGNCWRKMRISPQRKFGASVRFIAVLDYQKSGVAHLHVLVGLYTPGLAFRSVAIDWCGKIVDLRYVDVHWVSAYVTPYLTGTKIDDILPLLQARARIISRNLDLLLEFFWRPTVQCQLQPLPIVILLDELFDVGPQVFQVGVCRVFPMPSHIPGSHIEARVGMMHQSRLRLAICDCMLQRSYREAATHHRSLHRPPDNLARETIEDHR